MKKKLLIALIVLCTNSAGRVRAQLSLPSVISDHMVLKAESAVQLWGWGFPTSRVTVTADWSPNSYETVVDSLGRWFVTIDTPSAGDGFSMQFTSSRGKSITVNNVAIGQVWLCAGQSNMEWGARQGMRQMIREQALAAQPALRLFKTEFGASHLPLQDVRGQWAVCDSASLHDFGATGYFFGKFLHEELDVPVGLINSSWGGTEIEMWTPPAVYDTLPHLKSRAHTIKSSRIVPRVLCGLYNGMVFPLRHFAFSGVVWYQGESNFVQPDDYDRLFEEMVRAWRMDFGQPLPFYFLQIAPCDQYSRDRGARIMELQAQAENRIPDCEMIVITDLVEDLSDIHPQEKREVGRRLANRALEKTYGRTHLQSAFPRLASFRIEGDRILLTFENTYGSLWFKGAPKELYISGEDAVFYPARAEIQGNQLIVTSGQVHRPVSVRLAYGDTAIGNLFGAGGMPVVPFRLDDWEYEKVNYEK